jgi:hypothetical protein
MAATRGVRVQVAPPACQVAFALLRAMWIVATDLNPHDSPVSWIGNAGRPESPAHGAAPAASHCSNVVGAMRAPSPGSSTLPAIDVPNRPDHVGTRRT